MAAPARGVTAKPRRLRNRPPAWWRKHPRVDQALPGLPDGYTQVEAAIPSWAEAVQIQNDGKILAAGFTIYGTAVDFRLVRLNSDGSLDDGSPTDSTPNDKFGSGGSVTTDFAGDRDE